MRIKLVFDRNTIRQSFNKVGTVFLTYLALGIVSIIIGFSNSGAQPLEKPSEDTDLWQVEIIAFSKLQAPSLLSEQWNMPTILPTVDQAIELVPFEDTLEYNEKPQELPTSYWKLNRISRSLSRHSYTVLLHLAWIQRFSTASPPIHIFSPQLSPLNTTTQMDGTIDITLNRYFNVAINLVFAEPIIQLQSFVSSKSTGWKNFHNIENNFAYFQVMQRRRMKSNELNYIDHPLYGVLIKITPFLP